MDRFDEGFALDAHRFAWGTTLAAVAQRLQMAPGPHARLELPCHQVAGLPALRATLDAPDWDRPVLGAMYDLPPDPSATAAGLPWLPSLVASLGDPAHREDYDLTDHPYPEGSVRGNVRWDGDGVSVHLTIFGDLRDGAVGSLALLWSPERAAAPYVEAWAQRGRELAARLDATTRIDVFPVGYPLHPYLGRKGEARRQQLALHAPELLDTPPSIAARLSPTTFALWQHPASGHWGLSTRWDTREVAPGETVQVDWIELQPAKGGGWSGIELGSWSVRDVPDSRQVRAAVERIRRMPGAEVQHHEGHDC